MIKKELYAAPNTEVLELRLEGTVLAGSPVDGSGVTLGISSFGDTDDWTE